ncbi:MAG TPA: cupin domain-containing protein [Methanocella sp.]|uniref:cupin domain-containing protein n=1 Tax=Methanocella sp. TaxID=2052833 RepID=UPI002C8F5D2A|nr:cupin domain-containing protein [Methanocella sp.]HTY91177.1 cupin domain-containing protein [Methanocella sp.]
MDVFPVDMPEDGGPISLRSCPIKTDKVAFSVYSFQPWQALSMHRHTNSDEVFYVVGGRCLFYVGSETRPVGPGHAVYVPSGAGHAVLSCEKGATLLSVQGPRPVTSIYGNLEYFCPACGLETPLPEGTATGDVTRCPRCKTAVRLAEAGAAFDAEPAAAGRPDEARAL